MVTWDGSNSPDGLRLEWLGGQCGTATSHFGNEILTWTTPYLFRTPPAINLQVRGPANHPKDGMIALEDIVETDWAMATFGSPSTGRSPAHTRRSCSWVSLRRVAPGGCRTGPTGGPATAPR
jgi:hypothetical protein